MTIDEAIAHAREAAERNRTLVDSDELIQKSYDAYFNIKKCVKCAEEHEQLAEWLEELKAYREIGTVEEYKSSVLDIIRAYNKAIDDFANFDYCIICAKKGNDTDCYYCSVNMAQEEIAEQLKVGGYSEQNTDS